MRFTKVREVLVAGFADELNPNSSQPDAADVMNAGPDNELLVYYARFVDVNDTEVLGPTIDVRAWEKDQGEPDGSGDTRWAGPATETMSSGDRYSIRMTGPIFFQLATLVAPGAATRIQVYAGLAEES